MNRTPFNMDIKQKNTAQMDPTIKITGNKTIINNQIPPQIVKFCAKKSFIFCLVFCQFPVLLIQIGPHIINVNIADNTVHGPTAIACNPAINLPHFLVRKDGVISSLIYEMKSNEMH